MSPSKARRPPRGAAERKSERAMSASRRPSPLRGRRGLPRRGLPTALALCVALVVCFGALGEAWAYPQFAFKGVGDCSSCHHSPTGGGFANRWGRESVDAAFGDWLGPGNEDLTYDESNPGRIAVDLGADFRLVPLYGHDSDAPVGPVVIPMLMEVGGAASVGRWMLYASGTTKQSEDKLGATYGSREHWIKYEVGEGYDVRFGRIVLPFGIRQADHTQYVREDLGFDFFDQSYSVEVDYWGQQWAFFASMFVGDLVRRRSGLQERGGVVTVLRQLEGGSSVGLSLLGGLQDHSRRGAASLFGYVDLGSDAYAMVEGAGQLIDGQEQGRQMTTISEFLRVGWFAHPSFDLYFEGGHRTDSGQLALTKARAAIGANWQATNWFELAPQLSAENRSGVPTRYLAFVQCHFVY